MVGFKSPCSAEITIPVRGPKKARAVLFTTSVSWSETKRASGESCRKRAGDGEESAQALIVGVPEGCADCTPARRMRGSCRPGSKPGGCRACSFEIIVGSLVSSIPSDKRCLSALLWALSTASARMVSRALGSPILVMSSSQVSSRVERKAPSRPVPNGGAPYPGSRVDHPEVHRRMDGPRPSSSGL
jgi:hypothetical protein